MTLPVKPQDISETVARALKEDIGNGDITAELIPESTLATANLYTREDAVFCGVPWVEEIIEQVDSDTNVTWYVGDGDEVSESQKLATFSGNARVLLSVERCMLNFLQTLSATATISRKFARLAAHTNVTLLDTRKTLPGLRSAQKYAVAVGGCQNHRMGLYDGFLIKENHIKASGSIANAISNARKLHPEWTVEVEVESLEQLQVAIEANADTVLLDNFDIDNLKRAVKLNARRTKLEASGGVSEESLVQLAETGIDFISIGALTKNCIAVDLSLLFD